MTMALEKRNPGSAATESGAECLTAEVDDPQDSAGAREAQRPTVAVERGGLRFYVLLEWGAADRSLIAEELDRDAAFAAAGRARIDYDAPPVVDRTGEVLA